MSADWFCKIGERKVGPLSGQQLKSIVATGQLKPEHLVRRGSEGPWVPAGRIKGLFPDGTVTGDGPQPQGKRPPQTTDRPLPKTAANPDIPPTAQATHLPIAAEAPAPPAADLPQELLLGEHRKHHVEMNVDRLNIEATPVVISRRKVKAGLQGLKKDERKKLTTMLLCLIGGGMTFALVAILWAVFSDKGDPSKSGEPKDLAALAQTSDSGNKKAEEKPKEVNPDQEKPDYKSLSSETVVGDVVVKVNKPTWGAPPKEAKTEKAEVLTVPVRLYLKPGSTTPIALTSWTADSLKANVSLEDDQNTRYALLEQVAPSGSDGKTITKDWITVRLLFQARSHRNLKYLHLTLPAAAFLADGTMIRRRIEPGEIDSGPAKSLTADKTDTKP